MIREANAMFVKIVRVNHGKPTTRTDPHGLRWGVYDPLANVGFFNPKDLNEDGVMSGEILPMDRNRLPGDVLPASYHNMTLYCYLRREGSCPNMPGEEKEVLQAGGELMSVPSLVSPTSEGTSDAAARPSSLCDLGTSASPRHDFDLCWAGNLAGGAREGAQQAAEAAQPGRAAGHLQRGQPCFAPAAYPQVEPPLGHTRDAHACTTACDD